MSEAFSRARAMMALIVAAMGSANPQAALAAIPAYKSRGKGRGKAFDKRRQGNNPGKYMPHQGVKECARRRRQMGIMESA